MRGLLVLPLGLATTTVLAQEGGYIGVGFGNFDYQENFFSQIVGQVADEVSINRILGGFEFNEHLALEISYGKTGDIRQSGTEFIDPFGDVSSVISQDFVITNITALGQLPFDWGALLGGIGYFSSENDLTETLSADCCNTLVNAFTFRDDGLSALLGIEWRFGRFGARYGLRLEYQWWDITDSDASSVGLAVSYGF